MRSRIQPDELPLSGPLTPGAVYKRADLHGRFGGNRNAGIVPSKQEPVVLLFHTEEPAQQFYLDGLDSNGIYWYSGEGTLGDMTWTPANRAVRDHVQAGIDLLFFQRVQRKDGLWRLEYCVNYFCHREEKRPDKAGRERTAIIFGLLPAVEGTPASLQPRLQGETLEELRSVALAAPQLNDAVIEIAVRTAYRRSEAVKLYALARAGGICEACGEVAPFTTSSGTPFLEVHHIDRLADSGLDRIDRVAAVCPNCHRRCHYAGDHHEYNAMIRSRIASIESLMGSETPPMMRGGLTG